MVLSAGLVDAVPVIEPLAPQEQAEAVVLFLDQEAGDAGGEAAISALDDEGPSSPETVHLHDDYGDLPLSFEPNRGQTDGQVEYRAHGDGYSLFLTEDGAALSLQQDDGSTPLVLTMDVIGANPDAVITGGQLLPGVVNYFIGNDPSQWRTDIPTYAQVQYDDIYPGIDLLY